MNKFWKKVASYPLIKLRPNRDVENAYRAYEPSWTSKRLKEEANRQIYGDLIELGLRENVAKLHAENDDDDELDDETDDEDGGEQIKFRAESLNTLSLKEMAKNYKQGAISEFVNCVEAIDFGLMVDTDLPMLDLLKLNVR